MISDLIELDDRTYADLVAEARAAIPALTAQWTDLNESDPGIMLVEMLAWLTEMLGYRFDRIPRANYTAFLQLLNGPNWTPGTDVESDIRTTIARLRDRDRAITPDDYDYLIRVKWPQSKAAKALPLGPTDVVLRVRVLPGFVESSNQPAPAHVSVVLLTANPPSYTAAPDSPLWQHLFTYLDHRRLLTTKVHLLAPRVATLSLAATITVRSDAIADAVEAAAVATMQTLLDPFAGGWDGAGWPFGRSLHISDVYRALAGVTGVDQVTSVDLREPVGPTSYDVLTLPTANIDFQMVSP